MTEEFFESQQLCPYCKQERVVKEADNRSLLPLYECSECNNKFHKGQRLRDPNNPDGICLKSVSHPPGFWEHLDNNLKGKNADMNTVFQAFMEACRSVSKEIGKNGIKSDDE